MIQPITHNIAQWEITISDEGALNKANPNKLDYESGDYVIPENWKNIFKEKMVFPSNMLSLGFKIKE